MARTTRLTRSCLVPSVAIVALQNVQSAELAVFPSSRAASPCGWVPEKHGVKRCLCTDVCSHKYLLLLRCVTGALARLGYSASRPAAHLYTISEENCGLVFTKVYPGEPGREWKLASEELERVASWFLLRTLAHPKTLMNFEALCMCNHANEASV